MSYMTFARMLKVLEQPARWQVSNNRPELVNLANKVRQEIYSMYTEVKMSMDVDECMEVQRFCLDCHDCCCNYHGITLTPEMQGVEGIWKSDEPIRYYDRWREASLGIKCTGPCLPHHAMDQGEVFPWERDMSSCSGDCIVFRCTSVADAGKKVRFSYTDTEGTQRVESITLRTDSWNKTNWPVKKPNLPGAVILPDDLCGGVKVGAWHGGEVEELSHYSPWESVPSYKRIKIEGVKAGDRVRVKANRKFHRLYYDHDIVETDNENAITNLALYVILFTNPGKEAPALAIAKAHYEEAKRLLLGDKNRDRGSVIQDKFQVNMQPVKRSRLFLRRGNFPVYTR